MAEHTEAHRKGLARHLRSKGGEAEEIHGHGGAETEGTGGGFFAGHPHGEHPIRDMAHPHGDGHVTLHAHGGYTHHHSDGSVTHHDHTGQFLASEGGGGRHMSHERMNPSLEHGGFQHGAGHHNQPHEAGSMPYGRMGPWGA